MSPRKPHLKALQKKTEEGRGKENIDIYTKPTQSFEEVEGRRMGRETEGGDNEHEYTKRT